MKTYQSPLMTLEEAAAYWKAYGFTTLRAHWAEIAEKHGIRVNKSSAKPLFFKEDVDRAIKKGTVNA